MEQYELKEDLKVMYLQAPVFPNDVPRTYAHLEEKIKDKTDRRYFGYSQPNRDGVISYKACAEILTPSEPEQYQLETMTIKAGTYASLYIVNHFEDDLNIPNTFAELLKHPELDPRGFCLEIYKNYSDPDVRCLVPILVG